jgi:hypothetical protein
MKTNLKDRVDALEAEIVRLKALVEALSPSPRSYDGEGARDGLDDCLLLVLQMAREDGDGWMTLRQIWKHRSVDWHQKTENAIRHRLETLTKKFSATFEQRHGPQSWRIKDDAAETSK